jgi:hypothetical protein
MAEKSRPKFKAAEGFAVVSDWSEHPDVKKAIASGNISAIEAATKKARDEGRNAFKPKDRAVPIAELKEAYEASRAQEAARLAKIETIRNRKPRRAVGGDTAPPMPEPKPPFPVPEVPNFPTIASGFKGKDREAMEFWQDVEREINPRIYQDMDLFQITGGWRGSNRGPYNTEVYGRVSSNPYMDAPNYPYYDWRQGYLYPFGLRYHSGSPVKEISRDTPYDNSIFNSGGRQPLFPYFPKIM